MLTKNEINTLSLSPTKKDFVQIWNELLEVAGKLSERWDPTSTNESDPGIVILKALTGIADKLNYNIDKNTLEAFMPTAAQEDSMRKLCDMLGYNMKYYRSAETKVTIKYHNSDPSEEEEELMNIHGIGGLEIPKFTVITNSDKDISYFTTNERGVYISNSAPSVELPCMEGQIVKCESTADNGVITSAQISENNRFYLPETQIAENGIFVYNVNVLGSELVDGTSWEKVDNLNIQSRGTRVFKFGYDSYEGRPYIEFPVDYSELINEGLFIYYARTSGANGNVSPRTLTQLELPTGGEWSKLSADSFSVENAFAATSGSNLETIKQAYNNFKRTVGTFETLVTCRDYMNKIYTMIDEVGKPCVSNILVTDIRNDLNRAITICSCDDAGIFYKDTPLTTVVEKELKIKNSSNTAIVEDEAPAISHFDLVLYPFKSYSQIRSSTKNIQEAYDASFRYSSANLNLIQSGLEDIKTIAHNLVSPRDGDIISINNYLRLNAIVSTHSKMTTEEAYLLREKIKIALANAFNMRELDFGEEIPFESIVEVIEIADPRIKAVSLNEPDLYTTFSVFNGNDNAGNPVLREYAVASDTWFTEEQADKSGRFEVQKDATSKYTSTFDTEEARKIYNKLVVRNILAGRVPLFNYNTTFAASFSEGAYKVTRNILADKLPEAFPQPSKSDPVTIYATNGKTYTGHYQELAAEKKPADLDEPSADQDKQETTYTDTEKNIIYIGRWNEGDPIYAKVVYTETYVPEQYINNVIDKKADDNNITEITTDCVIKADKDGDGSISDVTLEAGEFIKFRAPNYITTKTYPAYVNYHLKLAQSQIAEGQRAEADTLLNKIKSANLWESVFSDSYLGAHKKTFTLSQKVSKANQDSKPIIENLPANVEKDTIKTIFQKSGCVKLVSPEPTLKWADEKVTGTPSITVNPKNTAQNSKVGKPSMIVGTKSKLVLPGLAEGEIISNIATLDSIRHYVDNILEDPTTNTPEQDFIISFEFEYIPFEASTLSDWERFVLAKFNPEAANAVLWRSYGEGYTPGRYIFGNNQAKLLPFTSEYFGLLAKYDSYLDGVYVATSLGRDQASNFIDNNEEYELGPNEYLYIEYTPSNTTDEGTTQTQESVKETYGPGTIIRPTGFEDGLKDSSAYESEGHSPLKTVNFSTTSSNQSGEKALHSLGVNEQIEIRELSKVVLDKNSFAGSSTIYVYKNFNNCPELEENRDGRAKKYTLKDGEYIFYTGQDKTEFAYYGAGTEVTLTGRVLLEKRDIIEISTIFDSGIQEIPWQPIPLIYDDGIAFQEYQYITLGAGDALNKLSLPSAPEPNLNGNWQYCDTVLYTPAGADQANGLPKIKVSGRTGNGWEASSVFELNASPSTTQSIRKTAKVETSVTLHQPYSSGTGETTFSIAVPDNVEGTLSFKSNIACQTNNGKVKLSELYANPNKLESFAFKVFSEQVPNVIKTKVGSLFPYDENGANTTTWQTDSEIISHTADYWNQIDLDHITPVVDKVAGVESPRYDRALKLSVATLPYTYGIFSVYLPKTIANNEVWLELLPGMPLNTLELFNAGADEDDWDGNKFFLKPGLNCIRVANTCDIFVKAKSNLKGSLYFDNLRLVNTKQVTHFENDSEQKINSSYGLNLSQLGYLAVSDRLDEDTFNIFNMRARSKLKSELTNKALSDIESLEKVVAEELSKISGTEDKVKKLEGFIDHLVADINAMSSDPERTNSLLAKYQAIYNDLQKELALKEALDKNEDVTDQLANLYNNFTDLASEQQELLGELDTLRDAAIKNSENLSNLFNDDILDDFKAESNDEPGISLLKQELVYDSLVRINTQYNEQLTSIVEHLNNIEESNAANIIEVINKLYGAAQGKLVGQVTLLFETAKNTLDSTIQSILATAEGSRESDDTPIVVNYPELAQQLVLLREQVLSLDITTILSKIDLAAEEQEYKTLALLVEQLKVLLAAEDTLLVQAIDVLLVTVRAKTNTTRDANIVNAIETIRDDIITNRNTRVDEALESIADIITDFDDYDNIISKLETIDTEQIKVIKNQLDLIATQRSSLIAEVTNFTENNSIDIVNIVNLPFGTEAILAIWPKYIKRVLSAEVTNLYSSIRALLKLKGGSQPNIATIENRSALAKLSNIESFQELLERANNLVDKESQNTARKALINALSSFDTPSANLTTALSEISDNAINATIYNIAYKLTTTSQALTILEKQQLFKLLSEELVKEINLDTQLVNIAAKLLCPSVLTFEEVLPEATEEDTFYQKARDYISGLKNTLIAADSIAGWCTENSITEITKNVFKPSVLPATYLNNRTYQQELHAIKECALFNWLTIKDLKVAWKMPTGSWVDRYGKEFGDHEVGDYIKNTNNVWTDTADNAITVCDDTKTTWSHYTGDESKAIRVTFDELASLMNTLLEDVSELGRTRIPDDYKKAHGMDIIELEEQLLEEIHTIDKNRDFYYNVPVEANVAIDFNEGDSKLNTLMNPAINYDINNVNNSFVISKLDINYLDTGIQIARSSRI